MSTTGAITNHLCLIDHKSKPIKSNVQLLNVKILCILSFNLKSILLFSDIYGYTPLHYAAEENQAEVMRLLIKHHANFNTTNRLKVMFLFYDIVVNYNIAK